MILHLTIDTTGLNFYGEGEWKIKKHGTNGKRRVVWKKLDIAVNASTHEIIAAELSLSTVTNGEEAAFLERGHSRNLAVGCQKLYSSNRYWKERYGYNKRSLSETAMFRIKHSLGGRLSLRNYNAQVGETYAMIKALNKLTGLGMPETCRVD
ncbi:hypothetical protein VCRA2126O85_230035 [Vibrio crassostreae]|nr:hypothetical protein VCRA2128O106_210052 [Vibrio crassostreae]CAK2758533.1 hypothetical protein VCRA2125O83_210034 [Vibrio crassostreae]CAK2760847.1 hypothetical protein VCRA2128O100_230050 [Vibrio crassostreae]CAK2764047.1 hypothetical protein VCRA2127O91_230034 [Vibrio crassostreae]CAK2769243.1 hypothetical protein VCRA2126O85_230035 [Vibrio crassostreae]